MQMSSRSAPAKCRSTYKSAVSCIAGVASLATVSQALTFTPVPDPHLDLSELGRIGIAGNFTGISYYQYEGQTENSYSTNGTQALMARLPNGVFENLVTADASIQTMCIFDDALILGGNFTSLNGVESQAVAQYDLNTGEVTPLTGVTGQINALLCDNDAGMVYVGGSFTTETDSNNAITWVGGKGWTNLPFAGFNGPVTSISQLSDGNVIFGGSFTALGNSTASTEHNANNEQVINIDTATISVEQGSDVAAFSDPKSVTCPDPDGSDSTWLLRDGVPGSWTATFGFGFTPTKLRIYNTQQDGRGTKTFMYRAFPIGGIMNLTYTDPATGQNASCTRECPLSHDPSIEYQDFTFVNTVGMNQVRIDLLDFYGPGAGLDGIQLFQNGIYTYAIDDFNEPACSNTTTPAKATATGPWKTTASGESNSQYLSASLSAPITSDAAEVVFYPDIKESGSYSIMLYTPGCQADGTCAQRGQVDVVGTLTAEGGEESLFSVFQTNDFDKYDPIQRNITATTDSFRPSITLRPMAGQTLQDPNSDLILVAQSIGYVAQNITANGLNGLYEYDSDNPSITTDDLVNSTFVKLGNSFDSSSAVSALVTSSDDVTYIGGNFTSDTIQNIASIDGTDSTSTLGGGLNGPVVSMYLSGDGKLFVGGQFDATKGGDVSDLGNVAVYDVGDNTWSPLGAGVDGAVKRVVPMTLNVSNTEEEVISLTGDFSNILASAVNDAIAVDGFAIWIKSQSTWLQSSDSEVPLVEGTLSSSLLGLDNNTSLYGGALSAQALSAVGVAAMSNTLDSFPITIVPAEDEPSASSAKRELLASDVDSLYGVVTGLYDTSNGRNITVLGGRFAGKASDGSTIYNLAIVDNDDSDKVSGAGGDIDEQSTFMALAVSGDNLLAGGHVTGTVSGATVDGFVSYNLASMSFNTQLPALEGSTVVVTAIEPRLDSTSDVYIGGTFDSAGSLPCPGVCYYNTGANQWTRPGFGLEGNVTSMMWTSNTVLLAAGDLTVNGTQTSLASYDVSSTSWSIFDGAGKLPGPISAFTQATQDGTQFWASGVDSDGAPYLMKYDGSAWVDAGVTIESNSTVHSLQMFTTTEDHDDTDTMPKNEILMLTGSIVVPDFGTASAVYFDGEAIQPFVLTSNTNNTAGSIARVFVENEAGFFSTTPSNSMALGFVVLIALAISLGLMLMIVAAGILLDRYRKKRDGYVPAPTSMYDRGSGMQRIPPHELLESLQQGRPGAPHI